MEKGIRTKKPLLNLVTSLVGQALTILIGLILPRLYILEYGSEVNGLLSSVSQFLVYLGLFESGIGLAALQELYKPVATKDRSEINRILSAMHRYYKRAGASYLVALALLSVVYPWIAKSELQNQSIFWIVLFSGLGNGIAFFFQAKYKILLQAEGKNYIITTITSVLTILTGIMRIVMVNLRVNVVWVVITTSAFHLTEIVIYTYYVKKQYPWLSLKEKTDERYLSQSNYVLIHQLAGMVFQNTDVLILTIFCDLKVVSVYSIYKLVITHLESILSAVANTVNYYLGQIYQIDKERFSESITLFETGYSIVAFSMFAVAFSLLLPFIRLYTSGSTDVQYEDPILVILFIAIAILTAMRQPMLMTINYAGHFKLTTPQTIMETIINLAVSLIGAYHYGIYGVLLGTVAALLYRTADIIIYANRRLLNKSPLRSLKIYALDFAVFVLIQGIYCKMAVNIDSFWDFCLIGFAELAITLIVYVGVHWIVRPELRRCVRSIYKRVDNASQ